ncbi:MAG: acyl-[acyl-carrier-protein]--UDP-N-acetylglucosamine O-acyltransferase [Ponticaulis sp.]|nr:acyl-[acyl-carrier-protein]--UDP-N-acetylglucosamine O-acyltransferase [Ponticaulis sp.]
MAQIHPTSVVEDGAQIHESVSIGPFCWIGPQAKLDAGVKLVSHVTVIGQSHIAEDCELFPGVVVGGRAQVLGAKDGEDRVEVGARTILREGVTIHGASAGKDEPTRVGSDCFFMNNTHVGHDCQVGNKCVFANNAMVGGHCIVADQVWFAGNTAIHQNSWIGEHAFIAAGAPITGDVIPYVSTNMVASSFSTLNVVGLTRRGFSRADMKEMRQLIRFVFASDQGTFSERVDAASSEFAGRPLAENILKFIKHPRSGRKLCTYEG